jgi:hypothetical protein
MSSNENHKNKKQHSKDKKATIVGTWFIDNPHKHTNPKCHTATGKYYMPLAIQHSY